MEIFNVVVKNGVTLPAVQQVALDPYKIVKLEPSNVTLYASYSRILYCRNFSRNEPCDDLIIGSTYATVAAILAALNLDVTTFRRYETDGTITTLMMAEWFIEEMYETTKNVNGTDIDGTMVEWSEGAFLGKRQMFVNGTLTEAISGTTTTSSTSTSSTSTTTTGTGA